MHDKTLGAKRRSAIVDQFVTTDAPLLTILRKLPEPRDQVARALFLIAECLHGRRLARHAIDAAKAVPVADADPELAILLLDCWAELECRIGQPSEAEALTRQSMSLTGEATHPDIRAHAIVARSIIADATGNKNERERLLREALSAANPQSPRRKCYLWELALFLARRGRATECAAELRELTWQSDARLGVERVRLIRFINAMETGAAAEARQLASDLQPPPDLILELGDVPYRGYRALLLLMESDCGQTARPEPGAGSRAGADMPTAARVVHHLLERRPQEALRVARLEAGKMLGSIFGTGFESLNLIRCELSCTNADAARRLLDMRRGRGNVHYLDDFFLARAELLSGNRKAAGRLFRGMLDAADRYQARGRLDFESRLACELAPDDLIQLARAAGHPAGTAGEAKAADTAQAAGEVDVSPRGADRITGRSEAASRLRETILRFANLDAPVLVTGETGTGKEEVARALHEAGRRSAAPFVAVNCASITETLLESELFGHERGAFTGADRTTKGLFEEAGRGTIFLDEIGDVSLRLQSTLLRVLETGEIRAVGSARTRSVGCRIVAATNADIAELAVRGQFRRDLLFRLQRLGIHIAPLRERRDDILPLVRWFLDDGRRIGVHATMSPALVEALQSYDWPGNVRELRNVIERMRLMHSDKLAYAIEDIDLKFQAPPTVAGTLSRTEPGPATPAGAEAPRPPPEPSREPPAPALQSATPAQDAPRPQPAARQRLPLSDEEALRLIRNGSSQIRRCDRLRGLFAQHGKLTRAEIIGIMGVSANTATKDLKALCDEGLIRRVEPSASKRSHYFVLNRRGSSAHAETPPP